LNPTHEEHDDGSNGISKGQWLEYNDAYVSIVSPSTVQNCEAYLLFYQRKKSTERLAEIVSVESLLGQHYLHVHEETRYINSLWMYKWRNMVNPGHIDALGMQCPHGNIRRDIKDVRSRIIELPASAFTQLQNKWGGSYLPTSFGSTQENISKTTDTTTSTTTTTSTSSANGSNSNENTNHTTSNMDIAIMVPVICDKCVDKSVLRRRRKKEKKEIQLIDAQCKSSEDEPWYLISEKWLNNWRKFINDDDTSPPGEVTNSDLVDSNGVPFPNLRPKKNYRAVTKEVWDYFINIYGGGPPVIRKIVDIYTSPVKPDEES